VPNVQCRSARVAAFLAVAWCTGAAAADFALSGFATLGYAISDQPFAYLRYIDDQGTFKADSIAGVQVEARFDSAWGATVQGVVSAPRTRDYGYEASIRWAFLSWRPDNEWLLRLGRVRPPVLINTQNAEVGVTYDVARLPAEVYSLSPVYDVDGAAVTHTWTAQGSDTSLDAYWGRTRIKYRLPTGSGVPSSPLVPAESVVNQYFPETVTLMGTVLTRTTPTLLLRAGLHYAIVRAEGAQQFARDFTTITVPFPPPVGGEVWVPVPSAKFDVFVLTLGADWHWDDWHLTAEYGQRNLKHAVFGLESKGAYITAARDIGKWTPYVTQARLLSSSDSRSLFEEIYATPVPLLAQAPPFLLPANSHQVRAHQLVVFDQFSTMVGAAYRLSASSKVKLEWMSTKVGQTSALFDGDIHQQRVNVFSVSYSTTF
jgi:hypothetical protein